ncbi:hypothetical protein TrVGV298_001067 [Trichoderma virens]|nr:hypothetical protein TrVGV298_001067 [Trichoderma virens]
MEEHNLPSHHQLFAALIPPSPLPGLRATTDFTGNPEDSNWRRQLLTLHVIFPSLLLPALDLLDRGLVSRILVANKLQDAPEGAVPAEPSALDGGKKENTDEQPEDYIPDSWQATDCKDQICMYTVQSAASTTSRRKRHTSQATKVYAVHLDAWSCSCGGFALDAYSNYGVTNNGEKLQNSPPPGWLGTLGLDRLASLEDFPCCKHLLACLLAEKWRKTAGSHVQDKYTTKEELAAIIGGS